MLQLIKKRKTTTKHGSKQAWWLLGLKIGGVVMAALLVFSLGVGVGDGRISKQALHSQNKALPGTLDYATIDQLYTALKNDYDGKLTQAQLLDGLKTGLLQATGDPYTEYFSADAAKDFNNQLQGTFSGIGAELGLDASGNVQVIAPIDGAPASKAGLRPQDLIVEINGQSTSGLTVDSAVAKIRGPKGTQVKLGIVRAKTEQLTLTITRDNITVPSVKSSILPGNIGYLQITQFSDDTGELAQKAAQSFKDSGVKGVVLDLRGNPGGLVSSAVAVSSLWLPEGTTIMTEQRGGTVVGTETATGNNILANLPTAVLIDGGSASASEITAGALHDNKVATLYGTQSYGKGSEQTIVRLSGGAEAKITIARWYRPNGQNIDKKGITPDQVVSISDADIKAGNDPQKAAAVQFVTDHE
ncbi:MAG TPA: S41 family peptidase [Candidatus Saccharimonadales bacterium]|nr:S41 family peptidase [Candidatus Saccharimonadales bacterium]